MEQVTPSLAVWGYGAAALAFVAFSIQLWLAWRGNSRGSLVLFAALASAWWCGNVAAALGLASPFLLWLAGVADVVRAGAWLLLLLSLLYMPGVLASVSTLRGMLLRPGALAVGAVLATHLVLLAVSAQARISAEAGRQWLFAGGLAQAIAGLAVVEQLLRNVPGHARWGIQPMCVAFACVFAFDLYLYADAFLFRALDEDVWAVRGVVNALAIPFVAITAARNRDWTLEISVSRRVVFHSTALLVSGVYLLAIAGAGYYVRYFGGSWGKALQTVFLFGALLAFGLIAFSGSARSKLKVFLSKHFFSYRYDYREEWLKFTRALSVADSHLSFQQLAIKALADLVESPGGGLWLRGQDECFAQAARWNMPESAVREPRDSELSQLLRQSNWIVRVDEAVERPEAYGNFAVPQWLRDYRGAWLVVPLLTGEELIGFIVLARPRTRVDVNWEVLDLLKSAGRQAASYLAQVLAAEALLEAKKFDAFNKMSAFVVHDIKNLVAQLSLLLKNAERHSGNPDFQKDMLDTIEHVVERMKNLLLQLRAGTQPVDQPRPVDLEEVVRRVHRSKSDHKPAVTLEAEKDILALCHAERMERVIGHLVQNALEATPEDGRVWIRLAREGDRALIEVGDTGHGMSAEFVRDRLFKPFQSTKHAGMGIGAYESQQYVAELGGKIAVDSRLNHGTRVRVSLPLYAEPAAERREVA